VDRLPAVAAASIADVIRGFVPTRRFAHVWFDNYQPDERYPSQRAARDRLHSFAVRLGQAARPHGLKRFIQRKEPEGAGSIYLDGGFGVGKTHLLAATYHAVDVQRRYLSFGELAYTISRLGLDATLGALSDTRLLCVDEFELDDVAQTRMAATFLRRLFERRGPPISVVTTSNTLPSDLGQGRFAADAFQRDIGDIAARFDVVSIDGEDFRHRQWDAPRETTSDVQPSVELRSAYADDPAPETARVLLDWSSLAAQLEAVHPVHYAQIARRVQALFVDDLQRIDDQAVALRLVHFVDKLYDQEVRLMLTTRGGLPLVEVFSAAYRSGGYEKKYRRCLSRLHELISETRAVATTRPPRRGNRQDRPLAPRPDGPPSDQRRSD
jgi:cell division protein ZapE